MKNGEKFKQTEPAAKSIMVALLFSLSILLLSACQAVPITGRQQVMLISDDQVSSLADRSYLDFVKSVDAQNRRLNEGESPQAAQTISGIRRVAYQIVDAAGLRGKYQWEVVVIKSDIPNAMVLPNGKIFVFTGLLPIAKNPAGLAAVLGHEVAHVIARHGAERMSQVLLVNVAGNTAAAALQSANNRNAQAISAAIGLGLQYGVLLPYQRAHESEADRIGLLLMAKAGYDPSEAIEFWQRMETAKTSGSRFEFLSTHPSEGTRRTQIARWLPDAKLYYADRSRPLPQNLIALEQARADFNTQAAASPIAQPLKLEKGSWYDFSRDRANPVRHELTEFVTCGTSECMSFAVSDGTKRILTRNFETYELRGRDGSWTRFSPALSGYRWPLRVGATWSDSVSVETSSGSKRQVQTKVDIVNYEEVEVRGRKFLAFKISRSINGSRASEVWYAPEVGYEVKLITYNSAGVPSNNEMVGFNLNKSLDLE
jgi:metalloendopeptidase OMA1, mitochondrial